MIIVNLTQHIATPCQAAAGVRDLPEALRGLLTYELTFSDLPTRAVINDRVVSIVALAQTTGADAAMIGGAPYLMAPLEQSLRAVGITPLYAFSVRESAEEVQTDGSVRKVAVFKHAGFVQA